MATGTALRLAGITAAMVAVLLAVWPAAAQDPQAGAAAQSGLRAVVLDPAQSHVDLASAVTVLAAGDGLRLDDATALVPDAEEVAFARSWRVLTLVNREAADQTRILSLDRTALWGSGIAPVRSGFVRLGNWRTVPDGAPPPERVRESTRMRPGEARYRVTVPAGATVTLAIPAGTMGAIPVHLWQPAARAAADTGRAIFGGLMTGALAIAFAYFAARRAGGGRQGSAGLAAWLTGGALLYELAAQGFLAAAAGWGAGMDARVTAATLAIAAGAGAHVLAGERLRTLPARRGMLARSAGWLALACALLALAWPPLGLPLARAMAFAVACGGLVALTAGGARARAAREGAATPAVRELRAGWALMAAAAVLAALMAAALLPDRALLWFAVHALGVLGVLVAAYALAGEAERRPAWPQGRPPVDAAVDPAPVPDVAAIAAAQRHALAMVGAGEAVWDLDAASGVLYVDPALEARLGLVAGALCGRLERWMMRVAREDRRHVSKALDDAVARCGAPFSVLMRVVDGQEATRWLELRATAFAGADGSARRIAGTVSDVTDRQNLEDALLRDVLHDRLTGLANRPLFLDRLERVCKAGGGSQAALILADLDRFKTVNESLGHAAADSVLVAIARRLSALMAPGDTLARIDGDTFAALIADWSGDTGPEDIAELVRAAIAQPLEVAGREIFPTASIGLAVRQSRHETGHDLLDEADTAMRRAKQRGDATVRFAPSMRSDSDELATESDLRRALQRGEIRLAYQPIVDLASGRLAGFEALMRWQHPERGEIGPDIFVPLAERTGMIVELGAFVLAGAAGDLAAWQNDLPADPPVFVSVNVSSRQILEDLPREVVGILATSRVAQGSLRLEVTESLVMADPETSARVLHQLKACGVRLALDDFGTGYSSLSRLQRFPFDVVKIDKSFVTGLAAREDDRAIVRSVVSLAEGLALDVVAEGVEDEETARRLVALGCRFGQGYFFGAPMDAAAAHDRLARQAQDEA